MTAPHPAVFALHKLLVAPRRRKAEKREKDLHSAIAVLELLDRKGDILIVRETVERFPASWRRSLVRTVRENHLEKWIDALGLT